MNMNRRSFFGVLAGAAVVGAEGKRPVKAYAFGEFDAIDREWQEAVDACLSRTTLETFTVRYEPLQASE